MRLLNLKLAQHDYNIYIDKNLLKQASNLESQCSGDKVLIVSNDVVFPLYSSLVIDSLRNKKCYHFLLADGEQHKNLTNYSLILDFLIKNEFRRNDTLIALGGGVVGDIGGFVAASYQRGMNLIQVPTSLLAQVDSSVGGKTAVNHEAGKNLIGAFYQPQAVFIDPNVLVSLPKREYISGFAEIIKYAMLGEESIKSLLKNKMPAILARDQEVLTELIYLSCAKKAEIVSEDEKEAGCRALLNLGHTFAHAIEKLTQYKKYLHGEAVSIGIHMAMNLSLSHNLLSNTDYKIYSEIISAFDLPSTTSSITSADEMLDVMSLDKKNINNNYRLILPTNQGCIIHQEKDVSLIKLAINSQLTGRFNQ